MTFLNDTQQDVLRSPAHFSPPGEGVAEAARHALHVIFPDAWAAEFLVAGLPAAARVVLAVAANAQEAAITVGVAAGVWTPSRRCLAECTRLCGNATLVLGVSPPWPGTVRVVDAMVVLDRAAREVGCPGRGDKLASAAGLGPGDMLRHAGHVFLKATGKPQDGLVSRTLNRPISRAFTRQFLRFESARPLHATAGTAVLAILMLAAMLVWPTNGALVGALLFQAASIFDGVDGEMARATYRTSRAGAKLDSLIDAATNLAFLVGLSVNLYLGGHTTAAQAGLAGMLILLAGLSQIGWRAHRLGQPINFEAVKVYLRRSQSSPRLTDILIWLTMRDFIAFAIAVLALAGFASLVPFIFLIGALFWLAVTSIILVNSGTNMG